MSIVLIIFVLLSVFIIFIYDKSILQAKHGAVFLNATYMGECSIIEDGGVTTIEYYDNSEHFLGKCSFYNGPGSSGGNKWGCNSKELEGQRDELGRGLPKYRCIIE